jgi:hypothetical protein
VLAERWFSQSQELLKTLEELVSKKGEDQCARADHWSFVTVLVIIVANLATIWNIDHIKKN